MPLRFACLSFILLLSLAAAQAQTVLTAHQLQNGQAVELDKLGWKYSPNDDPRFAEPQFDDSAWATLASSAKPQDSPSGWRGLGWFRLHLRVAPELANVPLNLEMAHLGASEVYVNGKLIKRFGVVGKTLAEEVAYNPNALPLGVVLQAGTEQVIAVRYSIQQAAGLNSFLAWFVSLGEENANGITGIGFYSRFREFGAAASQRGVGYGVWPFPFGYLAVQATAFFAFGILHLLLFVFFARQRSNLFYGLFLLGFGINDAVNVPYLAWHYGLTGFYLLLFASTVAMQLMPIALLAFLYSAFTLGLPRRMWFFLAGALFVIFWWQVWPVKYWQVVGTLYDVAIVVEALRLVVSAIRRRVPGAGIVGVGVLLFSLTLVQMSLISPIPLVYAIGTFGMILSLSIYLAREYARTNKNLEEQLVQVKQLSAAALEHEKVKAENDRRAAELEEARQLQLSMLPKKLPNLPHLDIAAYMKTATEVGGDYYDFQLGEDGTLTVAVGDATGHGLKAGTLVSSVKSLFVSLAYHPDISHIFHRISTVLKEMKLRGLFMAMTMVKVKGHQLSVSIAGMPSVLIYRALSGEVEEVVMRALPLGGMTKYQYQQQELPLAVNDVVVLMSDGLPERFNPQGEMLEEQAAKQYLVQHAQASAQQLIEGLAKLGDDWGGSRPQDDDVTFVVLKLK
ncbi:MAG TPA: SpoIIE family protein phosphatase [Blastocatellia bacterium]|nr:SpoIIE family protein phosphatase [Blastocatellia bacterium]